MRYREPAAERWWWDRTVLTWCSQSPCRKERDVNKQTTFDSFVSDVYPLYPFTCTGIKTQKEEKETNLLPSFRRAMAIRTLFRRKISTKMMKASMTAKEITAVKYQAVILPSNWTFHNLHQPDSADALLGLRFIIWFIPHYKYIYTGIRSLTEYEPGLTQLQVHSKVSLESNVWDGDIRVRLPLEKTVLPVTMPYSCKWQSGHSGWNCVISFSPLYLYKKSDFLLIFCCFPPKNKSHESDNSYKRLLLDIKV